CRGPVLQRDPVSAGDRAGAGRIRGEAGEPWQLRAGACPDAVRDRGAAVAAVLAVESAQQLRGHRPPVVALSAEPRPAVRAMGATRSGIRRAGKPAAAISRAGSEARARAALGGGRGMGGPARPRGIRQALGVCGRSLVPGSAAAHLYAMGAVAGRAHAPEAPYPDGRALLRRETARAGAAAACIYPGDLRDRRAAHPRCEESAAVAAFAVRRGGYERSGPGAGAAGADAAAAAPDYATPQRDPRQAEGTAAGRHQPGGCGALVGRVEAAPRQPQRSV